MRAGKKPNKNQSIFLKEKGLNAKNWVVIKNTSTILEIRNINNNKIKVIEK